MKKLESVLRKCKKFYQTYEKQTKIAVIALVVITALLLFGGNGEKEELVVEQAGESQTALTVGDNRAAADNLTESDESETTQTTEKKLVIDISGCVKTPGIYEVQDGTRLHQVIDMAGGLTDDADIDVINQAELVTDGQKILIPAKINGDEEDILDSVQSNTSNQTINGKININQADSTTLQEIPGIGPATAEKIIQHREANGRFQTIEDLKNVSGIGDKTFEKMKNKICV